MENENNNNNDDNENPSRIWIYHERQESLLCGQHALNNLIQSPMFTSPQLAEIAHELDALELQYMAQNNHHHDNQNNNHNEDSVIYSRDYLQRLQEGSNNVDEHGNFSIQVLKTCLNRFFTMTTTPTAQQQQQRNKKTKTDNNDNNNNNNVDNEMDWLPHFTMSILQERFHVQDVTQLSAFLLHKSNHWLAIRKIGGRFFNLNSTLQQPIPISHFDLGTQLSYLAAQAPQGTTGGTTGGIGNNNNNSAGYTIFCVAAPLPPPHIGDGPPLYNQQGGGTGTWHNMADLLATAATTTTTGSGGNGSSRLNPYSSFPMETSSSTNMQSQQQQMQSKSNMKHKQQVDSWKKLTGVGMRLDGKSTQIVSSGRATTSTGASTTSATTTTNHHHEQNNAIVVDGLTEEEQLQLALQLSQQSEQQEQEQLNDTDFIDLNNDDMNNNDMNNNHYVLPEEPLLHTPKTCQIQFRFPSSSNQQQRHVRRFYWNDSVMTLYMYAQSILSTSSTLSTLTTISMNQLELRAGFPPLDLACKKSWTLQQAELIDGISIQVQIIME